MFKEHDHKFIKSIKSNTQKRVYHHFNQQMPSHRFKCTKPTPSISINKCQVISLNIQNPRHQLQFTNAKSSISTYKEMTDL